MKRYPCEETTLDLHMAGFQVRLWITNNSGTELDPMKLHRAALEVAELGSKQTDLTCLNMAEFFAESGMLPGLAAVQVLRSIGNYVDRVGHMIYTEPFTT